MTLLVVGLDHRSTPVELRERLTVPEGIAGLWPAIRGVCDEAALLSTCNRVEVYAVAPDAAIVLPAVAAALASAGGIEPGALDGRLFHHRGAAAVRHLCRVAAGLDSMIPGEGQILGQVRDALEPAQRAGAAGPILSALFRQAVTAGKRARTETAIAASAASVSHAAVKLAERVFGDLAGCEALVVGAGEMAELAVRALHARRVARLRVANRTFARADALATRFGGDALHLDDLAPALARADIVITSTGAPTPVLTVPLVAEAQHRRRGRPLFLVDVAVPRDIAPEVGHLDNVFRYDLDDLQALVADGLARRRGEVARVEEICEEEVNRFLAWRDSRAVAPTIAALRERAEAIRVGELERTAGRLVDLDPAQRSAVEHLTRGIVNKLLHDPVVRMKLRAADGGPDYAGLVRDLFGLDRPERSP